MVDMVVHRHELRSVLASICRLLTRAEPGKMREAPVLPPPAALAEAPA
jgi:acetyl-CoA carboxylase carboxyl transferase subunit beta